MGWKDQNRNTVWRKLILGRMSKQTSAITSHYISTCCTDLHLQQVFYKTADFQDTLVASLDLLTLIAGSKSRETTSVILGMKSTGETNVEPLQLPTFMSSIDQIVITSAFSNKHPQNYDCFNMQHHSFLALHTPSDDKIIYKREREGGGGEKKKEVREGG